MKSQSLTLTLLLLSCVGSLFAQVKTPAERQAAKEQAIQQICRGAEITSGPEFDEVHRIMQRLAPVINQDKHRTYIARQTTMK
jgi:phosphatidylserine/phosphatidylglycerophosphate/cardiolipin synthase-like enzyme